MSKLFALLTVFFGFLAGAQAETETNFFLCYTNSAGFSSFKVTQVLPDDADVTKAKYSVKVDTTGETWKQLGEIRMAKDTPVFQGQFKRVPPPPNPLDPNPPVIYPQYMFVSINANGGGSLSVNADLVPLKCQQLVVLPIQ